MKARLPDIARIIRSKNAGPYELTLDIIFSDYAVYDRIKTRCSITKLLIAQAYHIDPDEVLDVIYFDPAGAVKVTMRRRIPSGSFGDSDIYGAQQHAPLLSLEVDID